MDLASQLVTRRYLNATAILHPPYTFCLPPSIIHYSPYAMTHTPCTIRQTSCTSDLQTSSPPRKDSLVISSDVDDWSNAIALLLLGTVDEMMLKGENPFSCSPCPKSPMLISVFISDRTIHPKLITILCTHCFVSLHHLHSSSMGMMNADDRSIGSFV